MPKNLQMSWTHSNAYGHHSHRKPRVAFPRLRTLDNNTIRRKSKNQQQPKTKSTGKRWMDQACTERDFRFRGNGAQFTGITGIHKIEIRLFDAGIQHSNILGHQSNNLSLLSSNHLNHLVTKECIGFLGGFHLSLPLNHSSCQCSLS